MIAVSARVPIATLGLLALTASASAECAWVPWVEGSTGSDRWSGASVPRSRFAAREDCQVADARFPRPCPVPPRRDPARAAREVIDRLFTHPLPWSPTEGRAANQKEIPPP